MTLLAQLLTPCIEWTGARDRKGYGQRRYNGHVTRAHRVAWIEANGPVPEGLFVLHHCDNPPCINPEHLYAGTPAQNSADMRTRGRSLKGRQLVATCRYGHPYDEANTRVDPSSGKRYCRECSRVMAREYQRRKRAATLESGAP